MPSNRRPRGGRRTGTQLVDPRWTATSLNEILASPPDFRQFTPEQLRESGQTLAQWNPPTPQEIIEAMWHVPVPPPSWNPSPQPDPHFVNPTLLRASGLAIFYDEAGTATITADPGAAPPDPRRPRSQRPPEPANTPGSFRRMYRLVRNMGVALCR